MLELEGSSTAVAEASGGNAPGESVTGLCKRISLYKNLIKDVTNDTRGISQVPLIEYSEYMSKKKEKEPSSWYNVSNGFLSWLT